MENKPYMIQYTQSTEPLDMETMKKLVKAKSPFRPKVTIQNWGFVDEVVLGDCPIAYQDKLNYVWFMVEDRIYRIKLFHHYRYKEPRFGYMLLTYIPLGNNIYADDINKVVINFNRHSVSELYYNKIESDLDCYESERWYFDCDT